MGSQHAVFALAGQIVRTEAHARRILRAAIATDKRWLIPQARSVARQLAKAKGGAL